MFTGIIKKTSKVQQVLFEKKGMHLQILNNLGKIKLGESLSINGVCSTVKKVGKNILFEYMPETLKLSNLGLLNKGNTINVERSMRMSDRLDGHIVLGHIDETGKIISINEEGNSKVFEIKIKNKIYLVYKASIAVEGISLTVAKVSKNSFVVKVLPYTLEHTNLKFKKAGDAVNLEFDILAKYAYANKK